MKSRLLIASAVVIAAMMLMSPFVMNGDNTNIVLSNVEGGVCINELSVVDGVLCDSSGQAFDVATPILIDDEADLRKLSEFAKEITFSGYSLYLTSDIKMTDEFDPIGNYDAEFHGTFDGQGYTISNLTVNASVENDYVFIGLFGYIGQNGVVKNVGLIDSNISASLTLSRDNGFNNVCAGGIAGYSSGTISNCYNTGDITANMVSSSKLMPYSLAGGIVGDNWGSTENCHNTGDVYASSTGVSDAFAGGISGNCHKTISNCYNTGNVTSVAAGVSFEAYAGGITGASWGSINDCHNAGNVSSSADGDNSDAFAGGIAGVNDSNSIKNCYNIGSISATSAGEDSDALVGGIAGDIWASIENSYNTGDVTAIAAGTYSDAFAGGITGWSSWETIPNCHNTGNITSVSESGDAYAGGIAGYNDTTISNCYNTGKVVSETCMGENSIARSSAADSGGIAGFNEKGIVSYCYNEGEISATNNAYSVIDNEETPYVDSYAAAGGIIGDTSVGSVDNCHNVGNVTSTANAANAFASGIAGSDEINISICYNTGNITATSKSNSVYVGGIAGYLSDGYIENCYNTGKICAYSETRSGAAGGIAGWIYNESRITSSYNTGNVVSESTRAHVGGIVGRCDSSSIMCSYNLGNIGATSDHSAAGGIAGYIDGTDAKIEDCYNMGAVESTAKLDAYAGGIAGYAEESVIYYCYNLGDVTARVEGEDSERISAAMAGGISGAIMNPYDVYVDLGRCYNAGNISAYSVGDAYVGGIAGSNESLIVYTYNIGNINAEASGDVVQVGGIAGYSNNFVWSCYNIGNVDASSNAVLGSIIGKCEGRTGCVYYLNETADAGIGQCADDDTSVSLTSEEMKGWNLLGYESEYDLNGGTSSKYLRWLPDIFNANNGYPILAGIPIHTQSVGEIPSSAAYILVGNETTQAENYLKPYTSESPAVEMHIVLGDLQNLERFSSQTPTFEWYKYYETDILLKTASFTPSEFGTYVAFIIFEDENGNNYNYVALPRTISEAIEYTISFEVPEDAELTVKDSSGKVISAESDGTYLLETGEYTYTVTKEGYKTVEEKLPVTVFDATVPVSLEEETNTIYYIVAAIVVILVVVAIAYFITKKK